MRARSFRFVPILAAMAGFTAAAPNGAARGGPAPARPAARDLLARQFVVPPDTAKPHTWWHWVNGNVTREGITADLEAMKRVGIAGAQIFNVDVGIPAGPAPFMSPQWADLIAHAVKEAHRLGIELCVHNCAGWSSSGGPWIKPDHAMQVLVWTEKAVHGPAGFSETLAKPQQRAGYFRDVAVYAFKTPETELTPGGAKLRIAGINEKACFQRGGRILPDVRPTPPGAAVARESIVDLTSKMASDGKLSWDVPTGDWTILRIGSTPTGATNEPSPASGRGLEVDKLSREAFDEHWSGMMATVVKAAGPLAGKTLNNALIDSYEVGSQNWTPKFREEFQKRRGYDPMPYLPIVTGRVVGSVEESERFLWDFRRTIADLYADNYYGYFAETLHKHGMLASAEPYGNGPFENIQSGGTVDIPMGEFWVGGGTLETLKLASSVGHTYGRKVIGAESFTADDQRAKWLQDPYSIKALGDLVFCLGVNRYIFHRYAMQPWLNVAPGMTMGPWGTNFERTVTWWNQGAAWMKYIARCQYLLQSGRFVADACYYYGDDGPNDLTGRQGLRPQLPAGHDFDGADARTVLSMAVRSGRIVLPDGMSYRVLVLPEDAFMTPAIARKMRDLVRAGAIVVGPKPDKSPSLSDYPKCDDEVRQIADEVWGDCDGKTVMEHALGNGRVVWGKPLERVFVELGDKPDFSWSGGARLAYIHRSVDGAEVYFVSNQRYAPAAVSCTFRVAGMVPELWHPDSGKMEAAAVYQEHDGRTTVPLRFEPAGSAFVVFRRPSADVEHLVSLTRAGAVNDPAPAAPTIEIKSARYEAVDGQGGADVTAKVSALASEGQTSISASNDVFGDPASLHVKRLRVQYVLNGKLMDKTVGENETMELVQENAAPSLPAYEVSAGKLLPWMPGTYRLVDAGGSARNVDVRHSALSTEIVGPWTLRFPPNLGAPSAAELDHLISWSDSPVAGVRYFSGTAEYVKEIDVPASLLGAGRIVALDLGMVKNIAQVTLNGRDLGVLWKPPFRVDVTGLLRPGRNSLSVKVTNLWPNRLIGDEQLPDDVQWNGQTLAKWPDWLIQHKPRPQQGRITFTTWRFFSKDSPLLESGLIGPVVVRSVKAIPLAEVH